jgi:hypothetical protein
VPAVELGLAHRRDTEPPRVSRVPFFARVKLAVPPRALGLLGDFFRGRRLQVFCHAREDVVSLILILVLVLILIFHVDHQLTALI